MTKEFTKLKNSAVFDVADNSLDILQTLFLEKAVNDSEEVYNEDNNVVKLSVQNNIQTDLFNKSKFYDYVVNLKEGEHISDVNILKEYMSVISGEDGDIIKTDTVNYFNRKNLIEESNLDYIYKDAMFLSFSFEDKNIVLGTYKTLIDYYNVVEAGGVENNIIGNNVVNGILFVNNSITFDPIQNLTGKYGEWRFDELTGEWNYTLDNNADDTEKLIEGASVVESLEITAENNLVHIITIKITGTDDKSVITSSNQEDIVLIEKGGVNNDISGDNSASGVLSITDKDSDTNFNTPSNLTGIYGDWTFDISTGVWTYSLNDSNFATEELIEGQEVTDSLTITSSDNNSKTITVQITGKDDQSVIKSLNNEDLTSIEKGGESNDISGDSSANGTLFIENPKIASASFNSISENDRIGIYGDWTFDASTGAWTYSLNDNDDDTQGLAEGEKVTESLTITTTDGTSKIIAVEITGKDDKSVITSSNSDDNILVEKGGVNNVTSGDNTAGGKLSITDVDSNTSFNTPSNLTGIYGDWTFDVSTGDWSYSLNDNDDDTQALTEGEETTESLTITTTDGISRIITVEITGKDDKSVITSSNSEDSILVEKGGVNNVTSGDNTAGGKLSITDVDSNISFNTPSNSSLMGVYGDWTFDASNGDWTYSLNDNDSDTQGLAEGEEVTESLTITTTDGISKVITVEITGKDDKSIITSSNSEDNILVEKGGVNNVTSGDNTAGGKLSITDPDSNTSFNTPSNLTGVYGDWTFNSSNGDWTYSLNDSDADTQGLAEGEEVTEILTITTSDGTSEIITVEITGKNDQSIITSSNSEDVNLVEKGGENNVVSGDNSASGKLSITDTDSNTSFNTPDNLTGVYGNWTFDSSNGDWTYSLNDSNADTQGLAEGEEVTESLTITTTDGTSKIITVEITGKDDQSVITASDSEDIILVEKGGVGNGTAGDNSAGGKLSIADADSNTSFNTPSNLTGVYGDWTFDTSNGNWTYSLNDSDSDTQALTEGEQVTESLIITASDNTTYTISVNITGKNDNAVITGDLSKNITSANTITSGILTISDVDAGESEVRESAGITSLDGIYTIINNGGGVWAYSNENLTSGSDSFIVTSKDGTTQTITINFVTTPVILDLDRDGELEYSNISENNVLFDVDNDGELEKTAWASGDDGILVYDYDKDNIITKMNEISFVGYQEGSKTDLEALAFFDSNSNNLLDENDQEWLNFKVWQDINQDGMSDKGEVFSLDELGIVQISLTSDNNYQQIGDVVEYGQSSYQTKDGDDYKVGDVGFFSQDKEVENLFKNYNIEKQESTNNDNDYNQYSFDDNSDLLNQLLVVDEA